MRHLKRFRNWIVVVYYACWSYSQQFQNKEAQQQPDQVDHDDFSAELEASVATEQLDESEVLAQQQQTTLELLDAIAQGPSEKTETETSAPTAERKETIKEVPAKPVTVSSAPVEASSVESQPAPAVIAADIKQPGTKGNSTRSEAPKGKYQPGAINEQTAQRLARLLVSEIKLYQKSKTEGDGDGEVNNIYDLLKEPIEKSRQHYKQRMGAQAIESMPDYFHSELVRTLCGGDVTRLGSNYPTDR